MIKAISFDIGGTLVRVKRSVVPVTVRLSNVTGISYDNLKKIIWEYFVKGDSDIRLFCKKIKFDNVEIIKDIIKDKNESELYEDVYDSLIELKAQGLKLVTISNDYCWNKEKLNKYGISQFFDLEAYSYELGKIKPDPGIFKYVQKKLNLKSCEIIHIGDSFNSDIKGANQVGWTSIYIDRDEKSVDSYIVPNYTIKKTNELIPIITQLNRGEV